MARRIFTVFLIIVVSWLVVGCLGIRIHRGQMNVALVLRENATPVPNAEVTLVVTDANGRQERFGPATTDAMGRCTLVVPERTFASRGFGTRGLMRAAKTVKAAKVESLQLEFRRPGDTGTAILSLSGQNTLEFRIERKQPPKTVAAG